MDYDFLRDVVLSSASKKIREDALDKLLEVTGGCRYVGGVPVTHLAYAKVVEQLVQDRKIMAIKEMRTATGIGLLESKTAVEALMEELAK